MTPTAALRPVSGTAGQVARLLEDWLDAPGEPESLSVRTSGSTGEPKDVALSRRAVLASATATLDRLGGAGQWLLALPSQHIAGLQVLVRSALGQAMPVLLDDYADLAAATTELRHERRYVSVVPTQLHRWLADPVSIEALATYDAVLVGGSASDGTLIDRAGRLGVPVVTTYGMTETCGGCVYDGMPLDGVSVALDRDGRIRLSGPTLFDGYVGRADLTAAVLRDGWLLTADLGRLDDDGRLEVLGRVDDVAVSGGVSVPLEAVRRRLAALPELSDVAVVGVPDPEWGARVVAVVTLFDGAAEPDLATLRDFVAAQHPRSWAPRALIVRDTLPLLDSGKVDRRALARELAAPA